MVGEGFKQSPGDRAGADQPRKVLNKRKSGLKSEPSYRGMKGKMKNVLRNYND